MSENIINSEDERRVTYDLVYNNQQQVIAIEVSIDGISHELGKKELWDLKRIAETCFDTIIT
ncbi:MAG: hypothetical protein NWE89_00370 [Candidatus Bathyarchaeota archaeon]|nr:hypothetical protein [Candidatus Bathyarchaeota archaeon]